MESAESVSSTQTLDLVVSDLVGPIETPSLSGSHYFALHDHCATFSMVRLLKIEGEAEC